MKYIAIILFSLSLALPVYAARMVTGTVPHVLPLQPAPAGVSPNYSGSIQHIEPGRVGGEIAQPTPSGGDSTAPGNGNGSIAVGQNSAPTPSGFASHWFLWLVLFLAVVFGVWWLGRGKEKSL